MYRNHQRLKTWAMPVLAAACLSGTQTVIAQAVPAPQTTAATSDAGATRYAIDSAQSDVRILVYKGGAMARLGHNHVVSSKNVTGTVSIHEDLARSQIEIHMPTASLIVDDAKARSLEGPEFSAAVDQDARDGTKKNLLREEVLDGAKYPEIVLRSVGVSGTQAKPRLSMQITIKGVQREIPVDAAVAVTGDRLTATGEFAIKQTDFKMKPFSVAMGAIKVEDQLKIKFSIVGLKQQ
jgi:polyisoprenoid-binding protein YceI